MRAKLVIMVLLVGAAMLGSSTWSLAETCYQAGGTVSTENITSTMQLGSIQLTLTLDGNTMFSETGSLAGNITGTEGVGISVLSHRAKFPKGYKFVTRADKAGLVSPYVRRILADGTTPCSFWIHETISEISVGTKLFRNITSIDISADGYTSNCPEENANQFKLSGLICVE